MQLYHNYIKLFIFIFLTILFCYCSAFSAMEEYYSIGIKYQNNGDWEAALKTWWHGMYELDKKKKIDPRLGIAFIELATNKNAVKYFGTASEIYLWSFTKQSPEKYNSFVIEEAQRIIPLLDDKEKQDWQKLVKENNPNLSFLIRKFWTEKDPRPSTKGNERLIEHWQRICYARQKFTRNKNSPYQTDDRGTIYIKYGEPDDIQKGNLGSSAFSKNELRRCIEILNQAQDQESEKLYPITFLDYPLPYYEIWSYENIGIEHPCIFLFSYREGIGHFGLQPGVDHLIPDFIGKSRLIKQSMRACYMMMYYAELKEFCSIFHDRYSRIDGMFFHYESKLRRNNNISRLYIGEIANSFYNSNKAEDQLNPIYKYADIDFSDYENQFGKINISLYKYRYFDDKYSPRLLVISSISPQFSNQIILNHNNELSFKDYQLHNTIILHDKDYNEIDRYSDMLNGSFNNIACFNLNHDQKIKNFTFASEAYETDSEHLFAIGKEFLESPSLLKIDTDSLELSDIIIGVKSQNIHNYSFPVMPANEFYVGDPLNIYFEIYHLQPDNKNRYQYSIEIGSIKLDKKGRKEKNKESISVRYDLESQFERDKQMYGIDISNLSPGNFNLFIKVKDRTSLQEVQRLLNFVIHKKDLKNIYKQQFNKY